MSPQIILVTGSTDGLGRAVGRELARRGATVLLHGRDAERLADTEREIRRTAPDACLHSYLADFASLDAVRGLARAVERDHDRLDVLINNAGIGAGPRNGKREVSRDGYELRFAVNYLAPFLLTTLLLPLMRRSVPARIVNVASVGQAPIDFDDLSLDGHYDGRYAYRRSKLALVAFTVELAERLAAGGEHGVTVNALHPASLMNTKMVLEYFGRPASRVEDGVGPVLHLALAPELERVSGRYFDRFQEARAHPQVYDAAARRRLWLISRRLVGLEQPGVPATALPPTTL